MLVSKMNVMSALLAAEPLRLFLLRHETNFAETKSKLVEK